MPGSAAGTGDVYRSRLAAGVHPEQASNQALAYGAGSTFGVAPGVSELMHRSRLDRLVGDTVGRYGGGPAAQFGARGVDWGMRNAGQHILGGAARNEYLDQILPPRY